MAAAEDKQDEAKPGQDGSAAEVAGSPAEKEAGGTGGAASARPASEAGAAPDAAATADRGGHGGEENGEEGAGTKDGEDTKGRGGDAGAGEGGKDAPAEEGGASSSAAAAGADADADADGGSGLGRPDDGRNEDQEEGGASEAAAAENDGSNGGGGGGGRIGNSAVIGGDGAGDGGETDGGEAEKEAAAATKEDSAAGDASAVGASASASASGAGAGEIDGRDEPGEGDSKAAEEEAAALGPAEGVGGGSADSKGGEEKKVDDAPPSNKSQSLSAGSRASRVGKPTDGPATEFKPDPHLRRILDVVPGYDFSMVMVTMWPPPLSPPHLLLDPYETFLELVRKCFDPADLMVRHESTDGGLEALPAVYLYPPDMLHVTVAMLHRFDSFTDASQRDRMVGPWRELVRRAARRGDWPKQNFKLKLDSAQIGEKAGILLWTETTGALATVRACVEKEFEASGDDLAAAGVDVGSFAVPNIIHSTFLRFASQPKSAGEDVQRKFAQVVTNKLLQLLFDHEIECDTIRLVCERRPYMHIPFDSMHVWDSFELRDADQGNNACVVS